MGLYFSNTDNQTKHKEVKQSSHKLCHFVKEIFSKKFTLSGSQAKTGWDCTGLLHEKQTQEPHDGSQSAIAILVTRNGN